ncbi:MAG: hypothetical protein K2M12_09445 [Muribaculaceae bacterium]|nr:hypothetical protein [Muribaculaceae bacterium]
MSLKHVIAFVAAVSLLSGCFTGIESTPRITAGDVRRQGVAKPTPEMQFMADVVPQSPALWKPGKRFYVADNRLSMLFALSSRADSLEGTELRYAGMHRAPSLTGDGATDVALLTVHGDTLLYRVDASPEALRGRERLEIPFTIELDPVLRADSMMRGNVYYITTPLWRRTDGRSRPGLRHVPVRVLEVRPGSDAVYAAGVVFTPVDTPADTAMVMMSLGGTRSPRNFATLFNFNNPRDAYPHITDDVWHHIVRSEVQKGMTRDECRLALGAPSGREQIPTTAGMIDRWSYGEGIYLIFEDGFLTSFRL